VITSVFVPILLSKLLWVRYQCPQRGPAPKRFAARARISLPIPRSMTDQPRFHRRVSCSKIRSGVAVVAYSPVPNAIRGRIRESLSQPRNLFGLESAAPENDQPFANLDRLRFARARKSLYPIARQFLDAPAKLFEQRSRRASRAASNFKL